MSITRRELTATPIVVGSHRYIPVAGDTTFTLRVPGGVFQAGYLRPLRIWVSDGDGQKSIRIPDRQLQITMVAVLTFVLAWLIERRRRL